MVLGLWHLGTVTAACMAQHHVVVGVDDDPAVVAGLQLGRAPLAEPGLDELLAEGLASGRLTFTTEPGSVESDIDVLWVCADTPVDDDDESDVGAVLDLIARTLPALRDDTLVLVSAQLPVGTIAGLEAAHPRLRFACSPENLRLGRAIDSFEHADRIVIGVRDDRSRRQLEALLGHLDAELLIMRPESAEMVKHALNAFFALSISFINEVGRLCEHVGADAAEVSAGLRSEPRIGPRAYLGAGWAFAGGTLARDVVALGHIAAGVDEDTPVISAIRPSNEQHRQWARHRLQLALGDVRGRNIVLLGLVYTPNTSTLRRSAAVALCRELLADGAFVTVVDPAVMTLPDELSPAVLEIDLHRALVGTDAVVVCTAWPQFRDAPWRDLVDRMRRPLFIDPDRFLAPVLADIDGIEHLSVGRIGPRDPVGRA
jgi:UDPglucose 6-dehydrogenase